MSKIRANLTANTLSSYVARHESLDSVNYLVAPVVLLVEGIHAGSAGPVFYPLNELQVFPGAWDGRPVTLHHPEINGEPVGASSPEAMKLFNLGMLFNTRFDSALGGLRSEVWLNIDRARRLAPEVLTAMQNGESLEVSTGLWFESIGGPGIWGNEQFETTATRFRPDHLALLPGAVGACSVSDGCGLRANGKEGGSSDMALNEGTDKGLFDRFIDFIIKNKSLTKEEKVAQLMDHFAINQPGMVSTVKALQSELDAMDREVPNGMLIHWLEEAFDDGEFVMRQEGPQGTKFFKGTFSATENEGVQITEGDFTEVREKKEFVDVSNNADTQTTNKEDENVSDELKKTLVDNLIACDKSAFSENHRAGLMAMSDDALAMLRTKDVTAPPAAPAAPDASNEQEVVPKTLEEAIAVLPEEYQGSINAAIEANNKRKDEAIENILAAPGNTFTKESLAAMNLVEVEGIEAIVKGNTEEGSEEETSEGNEEAAPKGNFSGKAPVKTAPKSNAEGEEPLGRPMG